MLHVIYHLGKHYATVELMSNNGYTLDPILSSTCLFYNLYHTTNRKELSNAAARCEPIVVHPDYNY